MREPEMSLRVKEQPGKIEFSVKIPYEVETDEDGIIVSFCAPLDIYSQGDTEEEAINNLTEAIQLFITDCYDRSTLDGVFTALGFVRREVQQKNDDDRFKFLDVPLTLLAMKGQDAEAAMC